MHLITSDTQGNLESDKLHQALGRSGNKYLPLESHDCIVLEEPGYLVLLPGRQALGLSRNKVQVLKGKLAVAGIPAHGFTLTLLPAYHKEKNSQWLPFFAYCAAGGDENKTFIAAVRSEDDIRWDYSQYNSPDLPKKIKAKLKALPHNRMLKHLSKCAQNYQCFTAQNLFYNRWEGGIPVSPACNASCLGCLSGQAPNLPPSPQQRLDFVPEVKEIIELGAEHLKTEGAIISFGQGCEGEPLLQYKLLKAAIAGIRAQNSNGTIHVNTNGSLPDGLKEMLSVGLNSVRISLNSAIAEHYEQYFKPHNYNFTQVLESMKTTKALGAFLALNLLLLPGVNDLPQELEALLKLIADYRPDMLQLRNLNIDPDYYFHNFPTQGDGLGIIKMLKIIKQEFPALLIGNSTPALR
jgi:wyosine [tRNA(Phe)-imidazoG37] synthetase (radical SAM superfamily)